MKIFIIVIFTLLGLYNGLLVFIFYMEHYRTTDNHRGIVPTKTTNDS